MNFEFSEEQNLLREQAQSFLADNCPLTAVRASSTAINQTMRSSGEA